MCGLAGWVDWERDLTREKKILENMLQRLNPRGPDDGGTWFSPRAAFGHRRLVVVDPEGGKQPMIRNAGGRTYVISYNGELYNTAELRNELEKRGHIFYSRNSDTEVLLAAFMEWGPACLPRLNGIFAFAVWDSTREQLFLARDRLGVKPLFYSIQGCSLLFGSELKALLAHPAVAAELDREGLAEIFAMGPSRTPGHGVFKGIYELKPAHYLLYDRRGLSLRQYWKLNSRPHTDTLDETSVKVQALLQDAVERQLVSDVPICTLLSGGLDSSAISAFAAARFREYGQQPLRTYAVDYEDNEKHFRADSFQPDADACWVEKVSAYLGTRHQNIVLNNHRVAESLDQAVQARDLPGMTDIDSSLYLFCAEVKKDATVALSGEAADEIFGGYPWFHREVKGNGVAFPWITALDERMALLAPELVSLIRPREYTEGRYRETLETVDPLPGEDARNARIRNLFHLNIVWFMSTLLDRKDRMSMACGLEVRVPFCDHHLVEYVWNIPWEMKNCDNREKGILRRALHGVLPPQVLARRKSPYPKTHHPAYLAAVKQRLMEIINDPAAPLLPLINAAALKSLLRSRGQLKISRPWFGQLMGEAQFYAYLIQVDTWLRQYRIYINP
ncbi:MAG: asparagine synthase (glutamine-hydrolyzing) [Bacillota bacterium]